MSTLLEDEFAAPIPRPCAGFFVSHPNRQTQRETNDFEGVTEWFAMPRFVCLLLKLDLLHKPKEIQ
jgi:hypothetical protein